MGNSFTFCTRRTLQLENHGHCCISSGLTRPKKAALMMELQVPPSHATLTGVARLPTLAQLCNSCARTSTNTSAFWLPLPCNVGTWQTSNVCLLQSALVATHEKVSLEPLVVSLAVLGQDCLDGLKVLAPYCLVHGNVQHPLARGKQAVHGVTPLLLHFWLRVADEELRQQGVAEVHARAISCQGTA